jgi:hypothetical protein
LDESQHWTMPRARSTASLTLAATSGDISVENVSVVSTGMASTRTSWAKPKSSERITSRISAKPRTIGQLEITRTATREELPGTEFSTVVSSSA